jgi:hypothetical protein
LKAIGTPYLPISSLSIFLESVGRGYSCEAAEKDARALIALVSFLIDSEMQVPSQVMKDGIAIIVSAAKNKNSRGSFWHRTWLELAYLTSPYDYAVQFTGEFEKANLGRRVDWELLGDWAYLEGNRSAAADYWKRAAWGTKSDSPSAREKYAHLLLSDSHVSHAFQEFKKISDPQRLVAASAEFEKVGNLTKSIALAQLAFDTPQVTSAAKLIHNDSVDATSPLEHEVWFYRLLARTGHLELALIKIYSRVIFRGATTSEGYQTLLAELHAMRNDKFAFEFWAKGGWWFRFMDSPVAWRLFDDDHESWAPLRFISTGENGKLPDNFDATQTLRIIDDFFVEIQSGPQPLDTH